MNSHRSGDGRLQQGLGYLVRRNNPVMARQKWPQRVKDLNSAGFPGTMWLAWTQNAGPAHQGERGEAAGDQSLLHLTFHSHIKSPCFGIGADGRVKRKALRAVF